MVQRLVALAIRYRAMVLLLAVGLVIVGALAFHALPIEAYPNPVPPMVEVIAQPPGWSAEETERYITIPIELVLAGMPGLDHVRSQSLFGLADVKCYFKWGTAYKDARQEVINRLQFITLPNGVQAKLSPWNAIGEIFRYRLVDRVYEARRKQLEAMPGRHEQELADLREQSLLKLKTIQDWVLERQWKHVPGVIDVTGYGGLTKEYHVEVDPVRLKARSATLAQLTAAIANANQNVGGQRQEVGQQSYTVRGIGLIGSLADVGNTVVLEERGVPVRVRDVASVSIGWAPRLGVVGKDQDADIVQGIILMRYGEETARTLAGVRDRLGFIRKFVLPPDQGVDIVPYYDRGALVKVTTHTVIENLLMGMGLVIVVLLLFLGDVRAALVTTLNIPLALLTAFCGMVVMGTSANLISLGAVDFGIVVDSTVIMVENIFRHLGSHGTGTIQARVRAAAGEVARPMAFSTLIIGVAFLPLFTMTGVSGVIFSPMARTYAFAIGGAILFALTLTPAVSTWVLPAGAEEKDSAVMRQLHRLYDPMFRWALRFPKRAVALSLIPVGVCMALYPLLGGEFMPKLEEGNFWIRATFPMSISLSESSAQVDRMREVLRSHSPVVSVVSQLGRPDDGTDVAGFNNVELFAPLKPFDQWPRGLTKAKLTEQVAEQFAQALPGVNFSFSQYISDNVEEAVSGVKGENSVKVYGPDIAKNEGAADGIADTMANVHGVKDLGLFRSMGQPSIKIVPDRLALARYGLNTGDVEAVVSAAIGGQAVTQVYEGEKSFNLTVRWRPEFRDGLAAIRNITVASPDGSHISFGEIASITEETGPSVIYREDGVRYSPVKFSVRGRDLKSTIADAQRRIAEMVHLPAESHLEWSGEINELEQAFGRLALIIPLTLLLITFLTYHAVGNVIDTLIVLINIPVACSGGVLALLFTGEPFSVSAAMGFISIFGIAIQDAILVVTYAQRQWAEGRTLVEGANNAAEQRLRPVLMTTLTATLGLTPAALSHEIGAQTQRPLAIVVIGGALILAIVPRLLQPPLLLLVHGKLKRFRPRPAEPVAEPL
jgi:cobalt-zinc-cadmium resistance protein CzcA